MGFPRYEAKQPITPDPKGQIAIRDVQSGVDRLQNAFQGFSNASLQRYQEQANYEAKQAGEQAGSQPGFKPSQPYTQADMVYQNAALEANKASVQLDISGNLQRLRDQVLDPKNFGPDALNKYNQLASAYQEGAFAAIPKEVMPSAKHYFDYYNQQSQSAINSRVDSLTRNQLQFQLFDYLNTTGKQASNAAFGGDHDAASALTNQAVQKLDAAVSTGLISGAQAAHLKNGYVTQEHQDFYLGQFSHLLNSDPTKAAGFISDFLHSDGVDMNPLEKMKMVTHMHAMWKQYQLQQSLDGTNLKQQMSSALAGVQNGEPSSSYASVIAQVQGFAPDKYPEFAAKMQGAEFGYAVEQALTYATPAEQQEILKASKPNPFLKNGEPDPAYGPLIAAWNHGNDLVKKLDKQWKDDPAGMAMKNPSVTKAVEDHNTAASGPDGKVQGVSRGTINPVDAMVNVQRQRGVAPEDISVMPKSIAASTVSQLKSMELPQQVETLQGLFGQYGAQYAPELSHDLQKAGLEFAPLLLTAVANNNASRGALPDVTKAMQTSLKDIEKAMPAGMTHKDVTKMVPTSTADWDTAMQQSYNGDTTQYRAQMRGAIGQYAAWMLANGKAKDPSSAVQSASDTLLNNFYSYSKFNGYKAAIPKQYDTGLVNDAFNHLWKEAQDAQLKVPQLYGSTFRTLTSDGLQKQYKADSISQAHLAVEPGDAGAVLVDNQGSPITTTDGRKFSFKFGDLGNAFSDIRTHIDTRKVGEQQGILNQTGLGFSTPTSLGVSK